MDILIVGVGNPGREYEGTRHNVAWECFSYLSFYSKLNWKSKFKGEYAQVSVGDHKVYILKPMTFMNLSGESVAPLMKFFKIAKENILVCHDEVDLPYGTLTFKNGGGLAGHNGLKSISSHIGGQDFKRLRIGVGRPVHGSMSSHVLSEFNNEEKITLDLFLKGCSEAIEMFIEKGFQKAAGEFSKKSYLE